MTDVYRARKAVFEIPFRRLRSSRGCRSPEGSSRRRGRSHRGILWNGQRNYFWSLLKDREVIILAIYPSCASEVPARQNAMTTAIAKEGIVFMLRVAIASFGVGEKTAAKKEFPQKKKPGTGAFCWMFLLRWRSEIGGIQAEADKGLYP